MLLASLFDLGLPARVVHDPLAALGVGEAYAINVEERRSGGLRGKHLAVSSLEPEPPLRQWQQLRLQLVQAPLNPLLQKRVLTVFTLLAEAEAAVHGVDPDQVHFHEVGALDALVDVVGVCAGLQYFNVDQMVCTPPPLGHGTVHTAHGWLPVPVPAVLEIARRCAIPLADSADQPAAELTTPTGLALAACWADRFALPPAHIPLQVGVGLGSRALDRPNLLRLVLADASSLESGPDQGAACCGSPQLESILVQQAQVDDATPEDLAVLLEALRDAGALDVYSQPASMKKGRSGWLVSALVNPEPVAMAAALRQVWWQHGTTLGIRERIERRWVLQRRLTQVETPLGTVRLKQALLPDGRWRTKPEHDDLIALASRHGLAIDQVRATVMQGLEPLSMPADCP